MSGGIELPSVPYYGTYRSPLSIDIPQDLASGDYVLKGEIWMNGRKISHNESEIFIAGQDWNNKDVTGKAIYVYGKRLSKYIFYSSFSLLTFATKK